MDRRQVASLFALVLTGCGGGGGGGESPTPAPPQSPPPPPPPSSSFSVSSINPADGSTDVDRTTALTAGFSAAVNPTSITPATVQLLGPEGNRIACDLSSAGSSVQAVPGAALPGDTRFTLLLGSLIADAAGRTLPAPVQASFTTASQAWTTTANVGTLTHYTALTQPTAVATPSGDVVLAWHFALAGADTVFASRYSVQTGTWSAPATVHAGVPFGSALGSLSLAACRNDDVLLFWHDRSSLKAQGARQAASSGTWSSLGSIDTVPPFIGAASSPAVAVDSQGNITLVTSSGAALYAVRFDEAGSAWSPPQRIDHPVDIGYLLSLQVAVDASDAVVAAWIQQDDTVGRSVYVARYDPAAAGWGAAQRAGTNAQQYMALAVDGAGAITVAWATGAGLTSEATLWSSRWSAEPGQWSTPLRLDSSPVSVTGAPVLASDAAGFVTAAWMQNGAPQAARYDPASGGWSAPSPLSTQLTGGISLLGIVADVAGNVTLALTEGQNQPTAIRYSATQGQWLAGTPVGAPASGTAVFANDPVAVVDGTGNVTLAWFAWNRVTGVDSFVVSAARLQ